MVSTGRGGSMQPIAARQWQTGILPSKFQGVKISSFGDPVSYIDNPAGIAPDTQRESIDAINVTEPGPPGAGARPRDPDADRAVRDGVQDADQRARAGGHGQGAAERARRLWREARRRLVCLELPPGPPARRARRPLHPALPPRLGPSLGRQERDRCSRPKKWTSPRPP